MAAGVAAKDLDVAPAATTKSENCGRFVIGHAAANQLQKSSFAHAGVFEIGQRRTGEDGQAGGMATGSLENNLIGETREAHDDGFAAPGRNLVELSELHQGRFGNSGAQKVGHVIATLEFFVAAASEANEGDTVVVGESSLARLGDLGDFGIGNIQAFESLDGGEAHTGIVECRGVEGLEVTAPGNKDENGYRQKSSLLRRRKAALEQAEKGSRKHG